jgi:type IV secretory pathway VirB3-like protein
MIPYELQSITSMGWSIVIIGIQVLIMLGILALVCTIIKSIFRKDSEEERILRLQIEKQRLENAKISLNEKTPDVNFDLKIKGKT